MAGNKFLYAILMVYFIELAMYLFGGPVASATSVFNLLFNPAAILSSSLWTILSASLVLISGSAIIVGNLWGVNIYALYTAVSIVTINFVFTLTHL